MNCTEFVSILIELVRGDLAESVTAEARAHAATCVGCAAALASQQSLNAALQNLSAHSENEEAPGRIEAALKLEFRKQHATKESPVFQPSLAAMRPRSRGLLWNLAAWAVAAAGILIVGVVVMRLANLGVRSPAPPAAKSHSPQLAEGKPNSAIIPSQLGSRAARNPVQEQTVRRTAPHQPSIQAKVPRPRIAPTTPADAEATTAFYPLPYGSGLGLDEGWEIVRVDMPVSALASLGIPIVNEQQPARFVQADVVLGEDGTPRAIRFVK